jgi:aquaporin Z
MEGTKQLEARGFRESLAAHWPEYLIEAALVGIFLAAACTFTVALQHPSSPVRQAVPSVLTRRVLTGILMGLTAIALIYSPWGQRSGAHLNPSVTLTFYRLGKIPFTDAAFYVFCQFAGSLVGVKAAMLFLGAALGHPTVLYAATHPGDKGKLAAAAGEFIISFLLMSMVLSLSNHTRFKNFTGLCAGLLVATYITLESPYSGMSMNPARSFGSALPSGIWNGFWIYLLIPPLAMFTAAEVYVRARGRSSIQCCKLYHPSKRNCIFCGANGDLHE